VDNRHSSLSRTSKREAGNGCESDAATNQQSKANTEIVGTDKHLRARSTLGGTVGDHRASNTSSDQESNVELALTKKGPPGFHDKMIIRKERVYF
jgi:hypothetical protein